VSTLIATPNAVAENEKPLVSVVIPTYKHQDTVVKALESVLVQAYPRLEIIVVNDGSPDDTEAVLNPYIAANRIHYVRQENQGQASARNLGIRMAHGKYIALLDDDDYWPEGKLAWQVAALDSNPSAVLVYGYTSFFGDTQLTNVWPMSDKEAPRGDVRRAFYKYCWLRSPGQSLIRADVLREEEGFDAAIWGTDDYDLYIRLAKRGPFLYEHRPALCYRIHTGSASRNYWRMYENGMKVLRKHFGLFPMPQQWHDYWNCRRFTEHYTSSDFLTAASNAWNKGEVSEANEYYRKALRIKPTLLVSQPRLRKNFLWALLGDRSFGLRSNLYNCREQLKSSARKRF
jgi:glycosyltransferase involved in cell wall biosynthesis